MQKKEFLQNFFDKKTILFLIIIFLLLLLIIIFFQNLVLVSGEKELLEKNFLEYKTISVEEKNFLEQKIIVLEKQKESINISLNQLQLEFEKIFETKQELDQEYSLLKKEVNNTIEKIIKYERELQESMDWFKTNSFLSEKQRNIILQLKSNCLKKTSNSCEINLGCFHLVNTEFQNFSYKSDEETSQKIDKMQSIEQFVQNKGGDCEDYSLFFKAQYNTIIKECLEEEKEIILYSWKKGFQKYWLNNSKTWFFENAEKVFLEKGFIYPTIICGQMYDFRRKKLGGHCMLAFTRNEIFVTKDLKELNNAPIIEPQNALYMGKINSDSNIVMIDNNPTSSFVNTIITNQDFFLYSNNTWNSYKEFGKELLEKRLLLEQMT